MAAVSPASAIGNSRIWRAFRLGSKKFFQEGVYAHYGIGSVGGIDVVLCRVGAQNEASAIDVTPIIDAITNPPAPTEEQSEAYRALLAFDTGAYTFPDERRGDMSQCDNADSMGMLRAVRECWPVYEFYHATRQYRQARGAHVLLANDPQARLSDIDDASKRKVAAAFAVQSITQNARYPAQFDIALLAHLDRFFALSRTRQFAAARDDAAAEIAARHQGGSYREEGFHNIFVHYNRIEMDQAINQPASPDLIEAAANARPIALADTSGIFETAFYDTTVEPARSIPLGVDPERELEPGDCNGTDYRGLLRAIRYCEPIFRLYRETLSAGSSDWVLEPSDDARMLNSRVIARAGTTDLPAADFFELTARIQQSATYFAAGEEGKGDGELQHIRGLLADTDLDFNPEMAEFVSGLKARIADILRSQDKKPGDMPQ